MSITSRPLVHGPSRGSSNIKMIKNRRHVNDIVLQTSDIILKFDFRIDASRSNEDRAMSSTLQWLRLNTESPL